MFKKTILTGIIGAAMFVMLSAVPSANVFTTQAQAAGTGCLPASIKSRLHQIRKKFGKIRIVSAHRPGARIAGSGKRSYHASCRAVDFHPPRGKYRAVANWLKKVHKGGVGTYSCGMHHIHIDNGPRVRFHHCVNKHGSPLRKGRKKRYYSKKKYKNKKRYAKRKSHQKHYSLGAKHKSAKHKTYYPAPKSVYKKTYVIYN
jgi:hypothetical protein